MNVICAICREELKYPFSILDCGHTYCMNCLENEMPINCPYCRNTSLYKINFFANKTNIYNFLERNKVNRYNDNKSENNILKYFMSYILLLFLLILYYLINIKNFIDSKN